MRCSQTQQESGSVPTSMWRLNEGVGSLGLRLTPNQLDSFQFYCQELVAWNRRANLSSVTEPAHVELRHFLDSLSVLQAEEARSALSQPGVRAIDVGSGAGFPGIPLALLHPHARMALLEATGKKVAFLQHIALRLGLPGVTAIHGRAEDVAHDPAHREQYTLALSRAVAGLPTVVEYSLPFCQIGGYVVAQRGEEGCAEAQVAKRAVSLLGGELLRVMPVHLPGLPEGPTLVVILKVRPTPATYPRRAGVPTKRPLR